MSESIAFESFSALNSNDSQRIFEHTLLSKVAYLNLQPVLKVDGPVSNQETYLSMLFIGEGTNQDPKLENRFLTQEESDFLIGQYKFVSAVGLEGTDAGAVSVFQSRLSGEFVVAVAGTDSAYPAALVNDLANDLDIAVGVPPTDTYAVLTYIESLRQDGLLPSDAEITAVGHSLGGRVAADLKRFDYQIDTATVISAPGRFGLLGEVVDTLGAPNYIYEAGITRIENSETDIIGGFGFSDAERVVTVGPDQSIFRFLTSSVFSGHPVDRTLDTLLAELLSDPGISLPGLTVPQADTQLAPVDAEISAYLLAGPDLPFNRIVTDDKGRTHTLDVSWNNDDTAVVLHEMVDGEGIVISTGLVAYEVAVDGLVASQFKLVEFSADGSVIESSYLQREDGELSRTISRSEFRDGIVTITSQVENTNVDRPDLPAFDEIEITKPDIYTPGPLDVPDPAYDSVNVTLNGEPLGAADKEVIRSAIVPSLLALDENLNRIGLEDNDIVSGLLGRTEDGDLIFGLADGAGREGYAVIQDEPGNFTIKQRIVKDGDVSVSKTYNGDGSLAGADVTILEAVQEPLYDTQGNVVGQQTIYRPRTLTVENVVSQFSSTIGQAIAGDNQLEQIFLGEAIETALNALAESVDVVIFDEGGNALSNIGAVIKELPTEYLNKITSAGQGAISSFLAAELVDALGIGGIAGGALNALTNSSIDAIISNIDDIVAGTTSLSSAIGGANLANAVGSFLGNAIANEIVSFGSIGGQIGSQLGSLAGAAAGAAIATSIGTSLAIATTTATVTTTTGVLAGSSLTVTFASAGSIVPVLGTVIGAAIGTLLGGVIGSLFGGTPRSGADVQWIDGAFVVDNVWSMKGGSEEAAYSVASQAAGALNGILAMTGGAVVNADDVRGGTYGLREGDFTYREAQTQQEFDIKLKSQSPSAVIDLGVFNALSDVNIAGGDVYKKRALESSLSYINAGSFDIETLLGDFLVTDDYQRYRNNSLVIDALISGDPQSTFSASWLVTLQRAIELGLHKRAASDWYGGWDVALGVYDGAEGAEYTPGQLEFDIVGKERVTTVIDADGGFVLGSYGDTIDTAGKDEIDVTGDLTITGDTLDDAIGVTINGEAASVGDQIDVAAIIRGDESANVITGGDLGNDIFGGGGDDVLTGGKLDDWLFGGDGDDQLFAGADLNDAGSGNLLKGEAGDDILTGGSGSDWLEGGEGYDELYGGAGDDILSGGPDGEAVGGGDGSLSLGIDGLLAADVLQSTPDAFSLSVDFSVDESSPVGHIVDLKNAATGRTLLSVYYEGRGSQWLSVNVGHWNSADARYFVDLNGGDVHNLTFTFDATTRSLHAYADGVELQAYQGGTATAAPTFNGVYDITGGATLGLGTKYSLDFSSGSTANNERVLSTFHATQLYDRVLTASEVANGGGSDALVNDLAFGSGSGSTVVDTVANTSTPIIGTYSWNAGTGGGVASSATDILDGGAGNDQYLFRSGSGSDQIKEGAAPVADRTDDVRPETTETIASHLSRVLAGEINLSLADWRGTSVHETTDLSAAGGDDVVVLGPGIGWENVRLSQDGSDLVITIVALDDNGNDLPSSDIITLTDWYTSRETRVEKLRLADGQEVTLGYTNFFTGTSGNDLIIGTDASDFIFAGAGEDNVYARGGDDFANGGSGDDVVDGGGNNDLVIGSTGVDMLSGSAGNDTVLGGDDDDFVMGNQSDDIVAGEAGNDIVSGGDGSDLFHFGRGDGHDIIIDDFVVGAWQLYWGGPTGTTATGYFKEGDTFYEGTDNTGRIVSSRGEVHDWIYYDMQGNGDFALPGFAGSGGGRLFHYSGADLTSTAANGAQTRDGVSGTDIIEFDIGIDIADIHMEVRGDDLVLGIGAATGTSTAFDSLSDSVTLKDWQILSTKPIEEFLFFHTGKVLTDDFSVWGGNGGAYGTGPSDADDTLTGSGGRDWLTGNAGDDTLSGNEDDDILNGNGGQDTLDGGEGEDVLFGGAGNDILIGGDDADILLGGDGLDIASYEGASSAVTASLADTANNTGDAASDQYDSIEGLTGSDHNDVLIGDTQGNDLDGGLGDDSLSAGEGDDSYVFGAVHGQDVIRDGLIDGAGALDATIDGGDDAIVFDEGVALSDLSFSYSGDDLIIARNDGADTIRITGFVNDANKIETLQFADGTSANLAGLVLDGSVSTGDDLLVGDGTLAGGGGNDTILGGDDADVLQGGDGNDVLIGGDGGSDQVGGGDGSLSLGIDGLLAADVLQSTPDAFSLSVDFSVDESSPVGHIIDLKNAATGRTLLSVYYEGRGSQWLSVNVGHWNSADARYFVDLNGGDVHNLTFTFDATTRSLHAYVDGVELQAYQGGTATAAPTFNGVYDITGGATLGLGTKYSLDFSSGSTANNERVLSTFHATQLYDRVLTASEVANGGGSDALVNDLAFGSGSGSTVVDTVANTSTPIIGTYSWNAGTGGGGTETAGDHLDGGAEDRVDGLPVDGGDWANYSGSDEGVTIDLASNTTDQNTATGGTAEGDWFTSIESVAGSQQGDDITGDSDHNVLKGNGGSDALDGADGQDVLLGDAGDDVLDGGVGEDNLDGGEGDDTLYGGADQDSLFGGAGYDLLHGEDGDDFIDVGDGGGQAWGGSGNDTLVGRDGVDILRGEAGDDTLTAGAGEDQLYGGGGKDVYVLTFATDEIDIVVNDGDKDVIVLQDVSLSDIEFTQVANTLQIRANGAGANISDWRNSDSPLRYIVIGGQSISSFDLKTLLDAAPSGYAASADHSSLWQSSALYVDNAVYRGTSGNDAALLAADADYLGGATFLGLAGDDVINGTEGSDVIDGGEGSDTLSGGLGDDDFYYRDEAGHDSVDGGDGIDRILAQADDTVIRIEALSNIEELSANGFESVSFDGGSQNGGVFDFSVIAVDGIADFAFGSGRQIVTGTTDDDVINAGSGDDDIFGGDGNDWLTGGSGADLINGGDGVDTADFSAGPSGRTINLLTGQATGGETDTLVDIENIIGSAGIDVIDGDEGVNLLNGAAGNDTLRGNGGDDVLIGGAGTDEFDGGSGYDIVDYSGETTGLNIDLNSAMGLGDTETYSNIEELVGSQGDDVLTTDGNVILRGGRGNDTFYGGAGDNNVVVYSGHRDDYTFNSETGVHEHISNIPDSGSDGTDTLTAINTIVYDQGGDPRELGITGNNPPIATVPTLSAETLRETDELDVFIAGGTFVDDQSDTLTLSVLNAANGEMLAGFIQATPVAVDDGWEFTVTPGVGDQGIYNLEITATDGISPIVAISTLQLIVLEKGQTIDGDGQPDTLIGGEGYDTLRGFGGNDILAGLAGADELDGGNDTDVADYSASSGAVTVDLSTGVGSGGHAEGDVLLSIENLVGSSFGDYLSGDLLSNDLRGGGGIDQLLGQSGNDNLYGDSGADILMGGDGDDVLDGGTDVDVLYGDNGKDRFIVDALASEETYDGGASIDTLDFGQYTRGINADLSSQSVEGHIVISVEDVIATAFNDILLGNASNNALAGQAGDDLIFGTAGSDTIDGGADTDGVGDTLSYEHSDSGVEAILSGTGLSGIAAGDQVSNVEHLTGTNFDDILIGDDFENTLMGLDGDDEIYGEGSADKIYGNDGNDRLFGGDERDEIFGGEGNDYIEAGEGGDFLYGDGGNDFLVGNNAQDIYVLSRFSGHDVIDNYDNDGAEDRVGYDETIGKDNLWFERGTYDLGTVPNGAERGEYAAGLFNAENGIKSFTPDANGTDVRVTVLGEGSSVVILDMIGIDGQPKRDYAINRITTNGDNLSIDVKISDLLVEMAALVMPPGTSIEDGYPRSAYESLHEALDNAWVGNTKPSIDLDAVNPSNVSSASVQQAVDGDGQKSINIIVDENQAITLNLLLNDDETPGGLALDVTGYSDDVALLSTVNTGPAGSGTITIAPVADASGAASFKATVYDDGIGSGASETIDINISVSPVTQQPLLAINGTSFEVNESEILDLSGVITANAADTDGSETLEIRLFGLEDFSVVGQSAPTSGSYWSLTKDDLDTLRISVPSGSFAAQSIRVDVIAKDGAASSVTTSGSFTIDPNAAPTNITISNATAPETADGKSTGLVEVGRLGTLDPDGDTQFVYEIVGGADAGNFQIGRQNNGVWVDTDRLYLTGTVDYETAADRSQTVRVKTTEVSMNGQANLSYQEDIPIAIANVPEAPQWTGALAGNIEILEIDAVDITLSGAADPEGAQVYYYFLLNDDGSTGNPGAELAINAATGELSGSFDYEHLKNQSYFKNTGPNQGYYVEVTYLATDEAISGNAIDYRADGNYTSNTGVQRSTPQTMRITVENANDELPDNPSAPTILLSTIIENEPGKSGNGTKFAEFAPPTDPDGFGAALYVDSATNGIANKFHFIGNSLYLMDGESFDYESAEGGAQSLTIKVRDTNNSEISSGSQTVNFSVTDKNEYAPTLTVTSLVPSIEENTIPLFPIFSLVGDDADGDSGSLTYDFVGGKPAQLEIVGNEIFIDDNFNFEALSGTDPNTRSVSVQVEAFDGEKTSAPLTINFDVTNVLEPTHLLTLSTSVGEPMFSAIPRTAVGQSVPGYHFSGGVSFGGGVNPVYIGTINIGTQNVGSWDSVGNRLQSAGHYWDATNTKFYAADEIAPILLDLDGDGVEMVALSNSTLYFDQNEDGTLDKTGWVGADDGLLVLDRNGNGTIDNGTEISFVQDLAGATTDMEGLVAYDTNQDGIFDSGDAQFGAFQVWQDANQDGVSQADELRTLEQAGVAGIDLALTPTGETLENTPGNVTFNTAQFIKTDGTRGAVGDVAFRYISGAALSVAEASRSNQATYIVPVGDAASEQALQSLVQAMASFGGDAGAEGLDMARAYVDDYSRPLLSAASKFQSM